MRTITRLKIRRYINRRSNSVIEQIEKVIARLQAWIERLDQEQDLANEAMTAELARIQQGANANIASLRGQIAKIEATREQDLLTTREEFTAIIDESRREAERARQVQTNVKAIAGTE